MSAAGLVYPSRTDAHPYVAGAPRFTRNGSAALEEHLGRVCRQVLAGIRGLLPPRRLRGVLLGGGYGRGEGGVWRTADGDRPYNDMEFYLFLRGSRHLNEWRHARDLHILGEILSHQAGVEIEFKIASIAEFSRAPVSMFSYDLVAGHRWILGNGTLLSRCGHHRQADRIPVEEATRLLMNRFTGLLLARERLAKPTFTAEDADFVRRNIAKAELALGDAFLASHGIYHWSCLVRQQRLARFTVTAQPAWWRQLLLRHASGVAFKLHPERSFATRAQLLGRYAEVSAIGQTLWLHLEGRRLRANLSSVEHYAKHPGPLLTDTSPLRNRLVCAVRRGPLAALRSDAGRHPREIVLRALPLLLWSPPHRSSPLLRELLGPIPDASLVPAYRSLWLRAQ